MTVFLLSWSWQFRGRGADKQTDNYNPMWQTLWTDAGLRNEHWKGHQINLGLENQERFLRRDDIYVEGRIADSQARKQKRCLGREDSSLEVLEERKTWWHHGKEAFRKARSEWKREDFGEIEAGGEAICRYMCIYTNTCVCICVCARMRMHTHTHILI